MTDIVASPECQELLATLAKHRGFLRQTVAGIDDAAAAARPTVSALCLGGIIKHVTAVERRWCEFIAQGPAAFPPLSEASFVEHAQSFQMQPGETVADLLDDYAAAAAETERLALGLPSLDVAQPLPQAPWFEPGARWSARRVLVHILAETAQHAGHADIIRESIDGAKTMG